MSSSYPSDSGLQIIATPHDGIAIQASSSNQRLVWGNSASRDFVFAVDDDALEFRGTLLLGDPNKSFGWNLCNDEKTLYYDRGAVRVDGAVSATQTEYRAMHFSASNYGDRVLFGSSGNALGVLSNDAAYQKSLNEHTWIQHGGGRCNMVLRDRLAVSYELTVGSLQDITVDAAVCIRDGSLAFQSAATSSNAWEIYGASDCDLVLSHASNQFASISIDGRLGIGTAQPDPRAAVQTSRALLQCDSNLTHVLFSSNWKLKLIDSSNFGIWYDSNAYMTWDSTGSVGIGASLPDASSRLRVFSCNYDSFSGLFVQNAGTGGTNVAFKNRNLGTDAWAIGVGGGASCNLAVNYVTRSVARNADATHMTIDQNGRIGIEMTPDARYRLAVSGRAYVAGTARLYDPTIEQQRSPAFLVHGVIGTENLYTWFGDDTIVDSGSSNTTPKEPFWKVYTGLSNTSFARLSNAGASTFLTTNYATLYQRQYMLGISGVSAEAGGSYNLTNFEPPPSNYLTISMPVKPGGTSHAFFFKTLTDRWSSVRVHVANKAKTSFLRLQALTNSYFVTTTSSPYTSWIGPSGSMSPSHVYHEWLMFSIPGYAVEQYAYTESNDNKSRYRTNLDLCISAGHSNTVGGALSTQLFCSGLAMRTNPYGLTFHGATALQFGLNGGNASTNSTQYSLTNLQWNNENLTQFSINVRYDDIRVPICPPKSILSNAYPDFYLCYLSHQSYYFDVYQRWYLVNPTDNRDIYFLGRPSKTVKGRYGVFATQEFRHAIGVLVPASVYNQRYIAFVNDRPYLNVRIENTGDTSFGDGQNSLTRGFFTEVVDNAGPIGIAPYDSAPIAWVDIPS